MAPGLPIHEVGIVEADIVNSPIMRAAGCRLEAQGLVDITLDTCTRVRQPHAVTREDMVALDVQLAGRAHCRRYQIRTRSFGAR